MSIQPLIGLPGIGSARSAGPRHILRGPGSARWYPGGGRIDGTKARDAANTDNLFLLRAGTPMGRATSGKKWANSFVGVTTLALTGAGTTVTAGAATITEVIRRFGATGTFKLIGPPTANGTARALTATYSGTSSTTATITALGANQVEQINFNLASTAGNLQLTIQKPDGTFATTGNIAWNATDATYIASMNTALDTASGVVGGIVASAIPATDTDLGLRLTYSGTGYAGLPWTRAQVALCPTTSTLAYYTPVTAAVDGRFVSGSFIAGTDGTETPRALVGDGSGLLVPSDSGDVMYPHILVGGDVDSSQILLWPSDTGLQQWIVDSLNANGYGRFTFDHLLGPV